MEYIDTVSLDVIAVSISKYTYTRFTTRVRLVSRKCVMADSRTPTLSVFVRRFSKRERLPLARASDLSDGDLQYCQNVEAFWFWYFL